MQRETDLLKRYDLYGWDFAEINPLTEKEVEWHLHHARTTGGPVLELASGTGRLLCKFAESGFSATGLDLSRTMMGIARENIAGLPEAAQKRVRLVEGDMSRFAFDEQFGLICIAGNSFRELTDREKQLGCLKCAEQHLRDDGVFLMTERRFNPSWFEANAPRVSEWTDPVRHPETGLLVQRRFELHLSDDGKWIAGQFFYRTHASDGTEHIETCPVLAPIMSITDYENLFAGAGLSAQLHVGYEHRPDDGEDPILCFVCRKK